tara:strand:+ start:129 stop:488 length:360 start_codon:yes stop_codon:yes gene_type:complete
MKIKIYSYSVCGTCKKALKWLNENDLNYELVNILETPPGKDILIKAIHKYGNKKIVFNTSGASYRKIGASVVSEMNEKQAINALTNDPKLIKRPFLITPKGDVLVGFKVNQWEESLKKL